MVTMLREQGYRQGTRAVVPESKGQRMLIRLMGWEPGSEVVEGSSADYPVERIVRDFGESFPVGTRMRANHDGFCEAGGDIRRIMAKTVTAPEKREDGMYAWAVAKEGEVSDFVRQFADVIGTSISVGAEIEMVAATDEDGEPILKDDGSPVMIPKKSERGAPIIKRFLSMSESPYNAVDFVEAPGADGAIVTLATENAKQIFEHAILREDAKFAIDIAGEREKTPETTPSQEPKKENSMDPKDITALAEALAPAVAERLAESQAPEPSDQPTLSQMAEAVVAAGLTEAGRNAVYARVDRGEALEGAIAAEAQREADLEAEVNRRVEARLAEQTASQPFGFGYSTDDQKGKALGTEDAEKSTVDERVAEFEKAFADEAVN